MGKCSIFCIAICIMMPLFIGSAQFVDGFHKAELSRNGDGILNSTDIFTVQSCPRQW